MELFEVSNDLNTNSKVYRYMNVETFMSFIEAKRIHFTNINFWDDKWEVILSKVPTIDDDGELKFPLYSFHERIFVQSWSLKKESDAMWRIYSPVRTGLQIATSIEKFKLIGGVKRCNVEKVVYFETIDDLLEKSSAHESLFRDALFKRSAFDHECEVRALIHGDFIDQFDARSTHVNLPLDPSEFIEGIFIDPRADDWFINAIKKYCERIGLAVQPIKSSLYETDPHLKLGLAKRWVPVND
jgi:hypothetical protein